MRIARTILRTSFWVAAFALLWPQLVGLPFLAQNPALLQSALFFFRNQLLIELLCAATTAAAVFVLIQSGRPWRKLAFGVALCLLLSRFDVFEFLFHPLPHPVFVSAAETKLDAREKLLAVNLKGHIRAYPVRSLSYHHIVNDVLEGVAVAATY